MAYIGRTTDGFGVRQRFLFTPDAGATSVSGTDANGATLTFSDSVYMDVFLNGVLLKAGTDYNTNTANTIAGLTATVANDEVTVLVYDIFTTADMVSATSGGTFTGNVTHSGTVTVDDTTDSTSTTTGSIQTDGGVGIAKKLYVGTDLDVDGTANLDVVDIDGALTQDGGAVFNEDSADVDFRVESNGNANMLFVDGGNNTVGIGTTAAAPSRLLTLYDDNAFIALQSSHSGTAVGDGFQIQKDTSNNAYLWNYENATMSLATNNTNRITIGSGGDVDIETGDIFFSTAGKGINLGVTSNTDSNTLDDYEEGTAYIDVEDSSGNEMGMYEKDGQYNILRYTKIGRVVYFTIRIYSNGNSGMTGADQARITDLPFTAGNFAAGGCWVTTGYTHDLVTSNALMIGGNVNDNTTTMPLVKQDTDGTFSALTVTELGTARLDLTGFYFTA